MGDIVLFFYSNYISSVYPEICVILDAVYFKIQIFILKRKMVVMCLICCDIEIKKSPCRNKKKISENDWTIF